MVALAFITLLGFWEWTQFVGGPSRMVGLIPGLAVSISSVLFVPFDVLSLNTVTFPHIFILSLGFIWWLFASFLAVTYPRTAVTWSESKVFPHLFGLLTLLPFFWSVVLLRAEGIETSPYHGAKLVLYVCLIVWAADSGAYFVGKAIGQRKMAPNVSPNKTLEGLFGGIVTAIIVGWAAAHWFNLKFSSDGLMIVITLVTVVISVLGDLVESMFKRASGIKDSSNIIPGHGGVLDRVDSLTAAFPVFAFLYFVL